MTDYIAQLKAKLIVLENEDASIDGRRCNNRGHKRKGEIIAEYFAIADELRELGKLDHDKR